MQEISNYFAELGYNDKEVSIFVTLRRLGSKPASTIASVCNYERVYTYKVLQKFVHDGIVAETLSKGVKHFWIPSLDLLKQAILRHQEKYTTLHDQFEYVQTVFASMTGNNHSQTPKLQIFEQESGVQSLFEDILLQIEEQNLIIIKFFGVNTFETQILSLHTLGSYTKKFMKEIGKKSIKIQSYIADGSLTMENVRYMEHIGELGLLPAGNDAVNIFIVGKVFYLIIYKTQPIGLKISSPELAWAMHFLLDQTVVVNRLNNSENYLTTTPQGC